MNVTSIQLAKRILELLGGVKEGESVDLAKLRDGSVLISKCDSQS